MFCIEMILTTFNQLIYFLTKFSFLNHKVSMHNSWKNIIPFILKLRMQIGSFYAILNAMFSILFLTKAHICKLEGRLASNIYYDNQILCFTSHGNECDVITITEKPNKEDVQSVLAFRK